MTNEELKAKYESLNSIEDAYAFEKENGYTGTMEDFLALAAAAADAMPMELDDMEQVAGGGLGDTIADGFNTVVDWVKANPVLTAEIVTGVVGTGIGVAFIVSGLKKNRELKNQIAQINNVQKHIGERRESCNFLLDDNNPDLY